MRWRARRGLLETDLVLQNFLKNVLFNLSEIDIEDLTNLLNLSDIILMNLLFKSSEEIPEKFFLIIEQIKKICFS